MAQLGELIAGRYRVEAEIGRGGMATVYRVLDTNLNVERALKELSASYAADEEGRAQFLDEARHAARLVHPNIVTIHDHFVWQDTPYIVMEYFPLGDVHTLVARIRYGRSSRCSQPSSAACPTPMDPTCFIETSSRTT